MAVNTSSSTPPGTYTLTITATSGALTHSRQVQLVVQAVAVGNFSISASPTSATATKRTDARYTVTISAVGSFTSNVTFRISGLPNQATPLFRPNSVTGSGTTNLAVSAKQKTPAGTYSLTITATGGGVNHSTTVTLVVQ
jgi:uncharacterized membrane protein